ncbi:uncharacterized protein [Epargyreus clarus]|uniref:uncharacterized protein n=1 Tax=Epargyreus clarus TaxID=520877 RepID=UPI003C2EA00B
MEHYSGIAEMVSSSKWKSKAKDNIERYVHRGGFLKGDDPQLLDSVSLMNTIGVAMGLNPMDPVKWGPSKMKSALKGYLVYFEGAASNIIDVIADRIRKCCGGDVSNYVTVLPIEVYNEGILVEVPLFRVHRYEHSRVYYIDTTGRYYKTFADWYHNNKLPAGQMAYPEGLRLNLGCVDFSDTPSAREPAIIVDIVDTIATVAGITAGVGLMVASGGAAAPLAVAASSSAVWGTGRAMYQLADKAAHGKSLNPVANAENRTLWLSLTANVVGFGAKGATRRLLAQGRNAPSSSRTFVNGINRTKLAVKGLKTFNDTVHTIAHYDEVPAKKVLMLCCSIAFWTKDVYDYKTADVLIAESYE